MPSVCTQAMWGLSPRRGGTEASVLENWSPALHLSLQGSSGSSKQEQPLPHLLPTQTPTMDSAVLTGGTAISPRVLMASPAWHKDIHFQV